MLLVDMECVVALIEEFDLAMSPDARRRGCKESGLKSVSNARFSGAGFVNVGLAAEETPRRSNVCLRLLSTTLESNVVLTGV